MTTNLAAISGADGKAIHVGDRVGWRGSVGYAGWRRGLCISLERHGSTDYARVSHKSGQTLCRAQDVRPWKRGGFKA